jgi:hypothetical protein
MDVAKGSDEARRNIVEIASENRAGSSLIGVWSRGAAA